MIPEEYKPLINKLIEATQKGTRNWSVTSDDSKFSMDIGVNGVVIRFFRAWDPAMDREEYVVRFEIINPVGISVDGFSEGESDSDYSEMLCFYETARRSALRIDKTISELMHDLDL